MAKRSDWIEDVTVSADFFTPAEGSYRLCSLCGLRVAVHTHHSVLKGMGGRKRVAKALVNDPALLKSLCLVCHDACHTVRTRHDNFSCPVCPHFATCYFGQRTYGQPYAHLTPPWPLRLDAR